jgi:hypothetical protein
MSDEMSDEKFRFNPADFAALNPDDSTVIINLNTPKHVLTASFEDIDKLAAYLKVLYRSTAYIEDSQRDGYGHFRSLETINDGGDNELVALALSTLNDIREKVRQAHQSL